MTLTKVHNRMVNAAAFHVSDYGATGDGVTDDTAAIQAAIDAAVAEGIYCGEVVFEPTIYRVNSQIVIDGRNLIISGKNAQLDYYGTSGACLAISNVTNPVAAIYPNDVTIRDIIVKVFAAGGHGIDCKTSHSLYENISVTLTSTATGASAYRWIGDETNGTGPYYNTFLKCKCNSQSLSTDHIGIECITTGPVNRGPNANTWIGGRIGQMSTGIKLTGHGNNFYGVTYEGIAATGTAFKFFGPAAAKCTQNSIYGYYVENVGTLAEFNTHALGCGLFNGFATGVTTFKTDNGTNNIILGTTGTSQLGTGLKFTAVSAEADALDFYEEGDWTPVIAGSSTAGTYELATAQGKYTRIGRAVHLTARIIFAGSITGGGSGDIYITGVPFAKGADSEPIGSANTKNVDLTAGAINLNVAFLTSGSTSTLFLSETIDNAATSNVPISAVAASDQIKFSITYFV